MEIQEVTTWDEAIFWCLGRLAPLKRSKGEHATVQLYHNRFLRKWRSAWRLTHCLQFKSSMNQTPSSSGERESGNLLLTWFLTWFRERLRQWANTGDNSDHLPAQSMLTSGGLIRAVSWVTRSRADEKQYVLPRQTVSKRCNN